MPDLFGLDPRGGLSPLTAAEASLSPLQGARSDGLGGLGSLSPLSWPPPITSNALGGLGSLLAIDQPLSLLLSPPPAPSSLGSAAVNALAPSVPKARPTPANALYGQIKRKAYFAFTFEDVMRVNDVRNMWRIDHPDSPQMRSFYDSSIWEKSEARDPEALKNLMREAVVQSSAICVLIGTNTWKGRWVKYEIARAVVDGRGLLAVHINGINHHRRRSPDPHGYNPLDCMGVYHSHNGRYYLYEYSVAVDPQTRQLRLAWWPYEDFKDPVELPLYIPSIQPGFVMPLSRHTSVYDFASAGHKDIGAWIDQAAAAAAR
jgi:MTH538 TIR-like domain (DUF1863)